MYAPTPFNKEGFSGFIITHSDGSAWISTDGGCPIYPNAASAQCKADQLNAAAAIVAAKMQAAPKFGSMFAYMTRVEEARRTLWAADEANKAAGTRKTARALREAQNAFEAVIRSGGAA